MVMHITFWFQYISIERSVVTPSDEKILQELPNLIILEIRSSTLPLVAPLSPNIRELILTDNALLTIPRDYFNGSMLTSLKISQNPFYGVPDFSLIRNSIKTLHLMNNTIRNISKLYDIAFPKMRELYLSYNLIETFRFQTHRYWPSLKMLNLNWNRISHLELVIPFHTIAISVLGNPWNCNKTKWVDECVEGASIEQNLCHDTYYIAHIPCDFVIENVHSTVSTATSDSDPFQGDLNRNLINAFVVKIINTVWSF